MPHTTRYFTPRSRHTSLLGRLAQLIAVTAAQMIGCRETSRTGSSTAFVVGASSSSDRAPALPSALLISLRLTAALNAGGDGTGCRTVVLASGLSTADPIPVQMLCLVDASPSMAAAERLMSDDLLPLLRAIVSVHASDAGEATHTRTAAEGTAFVGETNYSEFNISSTRLQQAGQSNELMRSVRLTSLLRGSGGGAVGSRTGPPDDRLSTSRTNEKLRRWDLRRPAIAVAVVLAVVDMVIFRELLTTVVGPANKRSARLGVALLAIANSGLARYAVGPASSVRLVRRTVLAPARQQLRTTRQREASALSPDEPGGWSCAGTTRSCLSASTRHANRSTAHSTSVRTAPTRLQRSWRSPASTVMALPLSVAGAAPTTPMLVAA